jgi:Sulfotransferase family
MNRIADQSRLTFEQFRPVFVVGSERSGTTLLAVLLGRHSSLAMTPETHFFRLVPKGQSESSLSHDQLLDRFLANKTSAELGLNMDALRDRFAACPPNYASLLRCVLQQFAADRLKPRCGEKTPLHLLNVPTIIQWFPDVRIVGIVRDGRDVVLSLQKMPWATERRLRPLCWRWIQLLRLARRWQRLFPQNFLLIRYEDLLRSPEPALRRLDEFAGLPFEETQLNPDMATQVVDAQSEPWKAAALDKIDPARISGWKSKATAEQIRIMNSLMGPALRDCGYEDTTCRPAPRDYLANACFHSGLFYLWTRLVEKHLPAQRARRRAVRQSQQAHA